MDQVNQFVSLVYPAVSSRVALCLIPPDGQHVEHRFTTVERLSRFLSYARYRNARGWNVYITPSLLMPHASSRCKSFFQAQQPVVYLDCDQPGCRERIKQCYPDPTLVVSTSKGRYQVYWRLDETIEVTAQVRLMADMAIHVGADRAATDVSRVLRLPGFWNRKPSRPANTVDIVFWRDHCVPYQSLSEPTPASLAGPMPPYSSASTPSSAPRVLVTPPTLQTSSDLPSESERDWYEVHRRLALGQSAHDVQSWLQAKRGDKRNPRYYAQLTVRKALQAREQTQRQH